MSRPPSESSPGRRWLAAAYVLGLLPGLVLAVAQPVWSRVDEPQHADVLAQYAHGTYPVEAVTAIRPETYAVMQATGVFSGDLPGRWPRPRWDATPPPASIQNGYPRRLWMSRHIWQFSYEAMQPPLFYALATPVWAATEAAAGNFAAVYAVRLLDVLLLALLPVLAVLLAWRLWPGGSGPALAAALVAALLPGLVLNGSQVTNDTLAAVLGSLALLLALAPAWTLRRAVLVGLVFGAALLTKVTVAGLAPALALALFWPGRDRFAERVKPALVAAGAALACLLPWLVLNEVLYHALTPARAAETLNSSAPAMAGLTYLVDSAVHAFITFWTGEPVFTLPFVQPYLLLVMVVVAFSLAGLPRLLQRTPRATSVLVAAVLGEAAVALATPALAGAGYLTPGRYAYPAVGAAAALIAAGAWAEFPIRSLRWGATGVLAAASAVVLAAFVLGLPAPPAPAARPVSSSTYGRGENASGSFSGFAIRVDRLARDRSDSAWIHVNVDNETAAVAEWSPVPAVLYRGRIVGLGDYPSSTPFPGHLDAGEETSGWIHLEIDPRTPDDGLEVAFVDIAVDGYTRVGGIKLAL